MLLVARSGENGWFTGVQMIFLGNTIFLRSTPFVDDSVAIEAEPETSAHVTDRRRPSLFLLPRSIDPLQINTHPRLSESLFFFKAGRRELQFPHSIPPSSL